MATVVSKKNKTSTTYYVQFCYPGSRYKLYGFTNKRVADRFGIRIEELVSAKKAGISSAELDGWLQSLFEEDPVKFNRLVDIGSVKDRAFCGTLQDLYTLFMSDDTKKDGTLNNRKIEIRPMLEFFGRDTLVRDITPSEADRYANFRASKIATATWGRAVKLLRQFFSLAVVHAWIKENPFSHIKGNSRANKSREYFVTREEMDRFMEACATARDRLVLALARYGGLRTPSELQFMQWTDIDLSSDRFIVRIPKKTAKREQSRGELTTRVVPLFPEVHRAFSEYMDSLPEGSPVNMFDAKYARNVDKRLRAFRDRAGLFAWPKLFQNMRSSREAELVLKYPIQDVAAWLGNTPAIAMKHYLQIRDSNIRKAAEEPNSAKDLGPKAFDAVLQYRQKFQTSIGPEYALRQVLSYGKSEGAFEGAVGA